MDRTIQGVVHHRRLHSSCVMASHHAPKVSSPALQAQFFAATDDSSGGRNGLRKGPFDPRSLQHAQRSVNRWM